MTKRYKEYWINEMEKPTTYFFSEKKIEEYVKLFPRGTSGNETSCAYLL